MISYQRPDATFNLMVIKLTDQDKKTLIRISNEFGLALNYKEMEACKNYFDKMKRDPTDIELQTIGQTWSEHCYHKTFKGDIISSDGTLIVRNLFNTYIAQATKELDKSWCYDVFSDNAGIIDFEREYAIAAKVETHNHPSAIEPFGGAATGIGGVIRDPLGVWAKPIACTNVLCFGPQDYDPSKLPSGIKHPKYIFDGVVAGIGSYGNNMGIPNVNGAIFFDESYVGNVVVYCGCIGILPKDKFIRATKSGDVALLVGGRTGRDGIHGVTFASTELTNKSETISRPAVQIANPIEEERLKRAIIKIRDRQLCSGITDLGGGGLSCAAGEIAYRSNCGIRIELEKVLLKYFDMAPWEIWISESQERMFLSVPRMNVQEVKKIFEEENVDATVIGEFTQNKRLEVGYQGSMILDLDLIFLFNPPRSILVSEWIESDSIEPNFSQPRDLATLLLRLLSAPNITSKESVIRSYDHEVQGNTVLKPLQGKNSGPNDAAVIKPLTDSYRGIVISNGMNPDYGKIDPYWMAASSIDEAIRNNISVGGKRIALLDNFTWGNPEKPDRMGGLVRAVQACYDYSKMFKTPFISGKDSLYNESPLGPVTPTLLITAIGIISDIRKTVSVALKNPGDPLFIVGRTYDELGGSEYYKLLGFLGKNIPKVRSEAKNTMDVVATAIEKGYVKACHDISEGGLAVAAAEMAFSGDLGVNLHLKNVSRSGDLRDDTLLFSESNSRFLLEVSQDSEEEFRELMKGISFSFVGEVLEKGDFSVLSLSDQPIIRTSILDLMKAWKKTFGGIK